jgi:hypothetical protein
MLLFGWGSKRPRSALVLETITFTVDADDGREVKDAIEQPGGQHAVTGGGAVPTAEGEIRGEDHRAALVAALDDLEEQVGVLAEWQIADLVNDQQL